MAKGKGFVYIMTTAVNGIIKIGQSKDWTVRCQEQLEENGYKNMNGLKTFFVVSVPDMDEYESTMHDIFRESRVISRKDNGKDTATELFAVDKNRAKRVLEKMGIEVFPVDRRKENDGKAKETQPIGNDTQRNAYTLADIGIEVGDVLICKDYPNIKLEVLDNTKTQGDKVKYIGKENIVYKYKNPKGKEKTINIKENDKTTFNQILLGYYGMNNIPYNWNSREKLYLEGQDKSIYEIAQDKGLVKKIK